MIPTSELKIRKRTALHSVLPGLRWWIVGLVFGATIINILDRLSVSVLAPVICEQFHLNNQDYAKIGTWFLLAYTISQGLSGWMHDRIGVKRGLAASVTVWSMAAVLHIFSRGLSSLCFYRVILGLGEGGNWPGAIKVITDWFPNRERAFALGIVNGGSSIGAVLAPPLIVGLQIRFGWQAAFLATGSLGFIWLLAWLVLYQSSQKHPLLGTEEASYILNGKDPSKSSGSTVVSPLRQWLTLLSYRQVWAIVLARLFVDPIWWLYILWLPEYLHKARGMSLEQIGIFASLPFISAGLGALAGGGLSGHLISCGWSIRHARKWVIIASACLMPCGILAARAGNSFEAIAWISVVTFGFQAWINNVQILPADLFSPAQVASVAGLGGVGAGIGSMVFTLMTGWVVDHYSYGPILIAASLLGPVGTWVLFSLQRDAGPIPNQRDAGPQFLTSVTLDPNS